MVLSVKRRTALPQRSGRIPERESHSLKLESVDVPVRLENCPILQPEAVKSVDVATPAEHRRVCEELQLVGSQGYGDGPEEGGPTDSP